MEITCEACRHYWDTLNSRGTFEVAWPDCKPLYTSPPRINNERLLWVCDVSFRRGGTVTDEYKGRLTENVRQTKAISLDAQKHMLIDSTMPNGLKWKARVKQRSRPLRRLTTKIRGAPPVEAPLLEGGEEDDETDAIVEGSTAKLVRSLLKRARRKKGVSITLAHTADIPYRPALPPKPKRILLPTPAALEAEQLLPFAE